jgi:putative lipoprotein
MTIGRYVVKAALVTLPIFLARDTAFAQSIQGTATYRERMALPPAAVFEAALEDVSRADAPAETIARTRVSSPGNPPIAFTIAYDPARILPDHRYVVRARILLDDKLLFSSDTATPVITRGSPTSVSILLRRVGAGQTAPATPAGARPLEGTYWKAIELAGKPTPAQDANREAHLLFQAEGRVSGSDGCNRMTGSYELKGDVVTFGQMVGTQMACLNTGEIERAFRDALKGASRLMIAGDRLELFDASGKPVAAFRAGAQTSMPSGSSGLEGTSWQLVKFQGGDGTTLTPDDGSKYTIEFAAGGRLTARIDCNRGRGTWKSSGANHVQFGPLALTRAKCPAGSLHDHIVKQWTYIRSYVIKDGHLFLSLMADGGIYEFEPLRKSGP